MQKHNDAMKTSGHSSLEKYTSHFIERVVCERELETEQNCNILTPTLMAITAFFPVLLGCSTGGLGAQPLCDTILIPASLQLQLLNRGPEGPLCWWFSLLHLISTDAHSIQPVDNQTYPLDTFDWMHLLFTQVHFLFWLVGRGLYATTRFQSKVKEPSLLFY